VDTEATLTWIQETVANRSQPGEVDNIVIVEPESPSVAAPAPGADERAKETSKAQHKKHGKAKDESHKRGKAKGQRHR
jgi:hypothetical protein